MKPKTSRISFDYGTIIFVEQTIIFASQSSVRNEIFSSFGIPYISKPANIDEKTIRDKNLSLQTLQPNP